jgi:hypothetical protein
MADEKTFAQIYREVKPIDTSRYFTNPFSSIGEFQRQVGYPIEALHKAY